MKNTILILFKCLVCLSLGAQTNQVILTAPNLSYPGQANTVVGVGAGNFKADNASSHNTILGVHAGSSLTTGERNTLIGEIAGATLTTGSRNIFIGKHSGSGITSGNRNIIFGDVTNRECENNTIIGWSNGNNFKLFNNVLIGQGSLSNKSSNWENNVIIGFMAGGFDADHLNNSVIIGQSAGKRTQGNGIMIGGGAGSSNKGNNVLFIGQNAGEVNKSDGNLFIGNLAGERADASESMFIGNHAVRPGDLGIDSKCKECTFIGHKSGQYDIESIGSTYVGYHAGLNFSKGTGNTFIGKNAGYGPVAINHQTGGGQGGYNTIIGFDSGSRITDANGNIFIGSQSAVDLEQGNTNIFIGKNTGSKLKNQVNNLILFGTNTTASGPIQNSIAIGSDIVLTESNSMILGNNVNIGIGTTSPKDKLEIVSNDAHASGLRFRNLTSISPAIQTNDKVLSVNEDGEVILTTLPTQLDDFIKQMKLLSEKYLALEKEDMSIKLELSKTQNNLIDLTKRVEMLESFHKCRLKKKI